MCSTPSGIMESVTPFAAGLAFLPGRCSTPSGIMESVTRGTIPAAASVPVLNAFRHHGIGHQIPRGDRVAAGQVLNAFRHHGIGHGWF